MNADQITSLLEAVQRQEITIEEGLEKLRHLPYEDLGFARVDNHRALRQGLPEVVYGEGKSSPQITRILQALIDKNASALATRISQEVAHEVRVTLPELNYDPVSRILWFPSELPDSSPLSEDYYAVVVSAGTSDMPVAEEAAQVEVVTSFLVIFSI